METAIVTTIIVTVTMLVQIMRADSNVQCAGSVQQRTALESGHNYKVINEWSLFIYSSRETREYYQLITASRLKQRLEAALMSRECVDSADWSGAMVQCVDI